MKMKGEVCSTKKQPHRTNWVFLHVKFLWVTTYPETALKLASKNFILHHFFVRNNNFHEISIVADVIQCNIGGLFKKLLAYILFTLSLLPIFSGGQYDENCYYVTCNSVAW